MLIKKKPWHVFVNTQEYKNSFIESIAQLGDIAKGLDVLEALPDTLEKDRVVVVKDESEGKYYLYIGNEDNEPTRFPEPEGLAELQSQLEHHIANKDNPHGITKDHVALGNVQNYSIASEEEAEAGESNEKYMTPLSSFSSVNGFINSREIKPTFNEEDYLVVNSDSGCNRINIIDFVSKILTVISPPKGLSLGLGGVLSWDEHPLAEGYHIYSDVDGRLNEQLLTDTEFMLGKISLEIHQLSVTAVISGNETAPSQPVERDERAFTMTFDVDANDTIELPLSGTVDCEVHWGDGSVSNITSPSDPNLNHKYAEAGQYQIKIYGRVDGFKFSLGFTGEKIISVDCWGDVGLLDLGGAFYECINLQLVSGGLGTASVSTWNYAFYYCLSLEAIGDPVLSGDTSFMFYGAKSFNGDISSWDVSNVTNMRYMFLGAEAFNGDLSSWDVSNVTDTSFMFYGAKSFNGDLSSWDVSNVTDMGSMFWGATSFNGDISSWDVSNVTDMSYMFYQATSFNGDISGWDVSNVTDMRYMFYQATSFNGDISGWDVSNVTDMRYMFANKTLSTDTYDSILISWSQLDLQQNVPFHAGNSKYSTAAQDARDKLINDFNWTITDGGPA